MALATNSTPGSIVLGGDLTGNANAPELRPTGVTPGEYIFADIVVDAKGRVVYADGVFTLSFGGDISGTSSAATLPASGVSAGSYQAAEITINSKGMITDASSVSFSGDLIGDADASVLSDTGVDDGTYVYANITVADTGRITAASSSSLGDASTITPGTVKIASDYGLIVASGVLAGVQSSSSSTLGFVKSVDTDNIAITSGSMDVGPNIPKLNSANTFSAVVHEPSSTKSSSFVPNLSDGAIFKINAGDAGLNVGEPADANTGDTFDLSVNLPLKEGWTVSSWSSASDYYYGGASTNGSVVCALGRYNTGSLGTDLVKTQSTSYPFGISSGTMPSSMRWKSSAWNGSVFCAVGMGAGDTATTAAATSSDGLNWTARTLPALRQWNQIVWNGSVFCAFCEGSTTVAVSSDGATWSTADQPYSTAGRAVVGGGIILRFMNGSSVVNRSINGSTWLGASLPSVGFMNAAWNGSKFCAVGTYSETHACAVSSDGITWISKTPPAAPSSEWLSEIVWTGTHFLCLTIGGSAWRSMDGEVWEPSAYPGGVVGLSNLMWVGGDMGAWSIANYTNLSAYSKAYTRSESYTDLSFDSTYKFSNTEPTPSNLTKEYNVRCVHDNGTNYCTYFK